MPAGQWEGERVSAVDGAIAWAMQVLEAQSAAVVDVTTGATLGAAGDPALRSESVAAAGTAMVLAGLHIARRLGPNQPEDLLVCTGGWFHLIRPIYAAGEAVAFVHVLLDRNRTNLALARRELAQLAGGELAAAVTAVIPAADAGWPEGQTVARDGGDGWSADPAADPARDDGTSGWQPDPAADPARDDDGTSGWRPGPAAGAARDGAGGWLPGPARDRDAGWGSGPAAGAEPDQNPGWTGEPGRDPAGRDLAGGDPVGRDPAGGDPAGGSGAEPSNPDGRRAGPDPAGDGRDEHGLPAALPRRRPNATWPGGRPVGADLRYAGAGVAILDQIVQEPAAPLDDGTMRRLAAALRRL